MKRKLILIQVLLTIVISLLCGFALFGCGGNEPPTPEVKDVTITAVDGKSQGKAGALHQVTYTAPEGSEVSTSVKLGGIAATAADYSYTDGGYIFYTAGEYTITVYASKDGMLGSASANITVRGDAFVKDVKISAATGETFGLAGALHVLSYTAGADCRIELEAQRNGVVVTDVEYDPDHNTIVFCSGGKHTVTVTAISGDTRDSAQTEIEITTLGEPTVGLLIDKTTVEEDEEVTLTHSVTYATGDIYKKESVYALYRVSSTDEYVEADTATYTVEGDKFIPHLAGLWTIMYRAQGKGGGVGEAAALLKCTPLDVTLSPKLTERQRIQTNTPTEFDYAVSGAADKFDITYDTHGTKGIRAEKGEGNSVRVTAGHADIFTLTVIYTHKADKSIKRTVDIDFYSVDSFVYSPVFGADPFDGMPTDVLTSMGYLLYFNAKTGGGVQRELTGKDAQFEVIENNVSGGTGVEILYAANDENYPYVIVSNFDNNTATGDFTVKMTLTDPYTGCAAVATKKFTVTPTTNNNTTAATRIQDYVKQHSEFFDLGAMNLDNLSSDCRQNMVLTKTGLIMHRRNESWPLKDGSGSENSDFAHMDFDSAAKNCRLEFKYTLLAPNPASGEVWLGIGMRTVTTGGWVGFFDLHVVNGKLDITTGLQGNDKEYISAAERPLAANNTTIYLRIDRRVNGSLAEYTVYFKTEESGAYEQVYRCTAATSTSGGNVGAPVKQYQFTHRNAGGCYAIENVSLSDFGA